MVAGVGGAGRWALRVDMLIRAASSRTGLLAASGVWKDDYTFEITLRYYEMPHHDTVTCRFNRNQTEIAFVSSIAAMTPSPKDKRPVLRGRFG